MHTNLLHAQSTGAAAKAQPDLRTGGLEVPASQRVNIAGAPRLGRAEAPVTIVEFAGFQCDRCAKFSTNVLPLIKRDYVETGKVLYVFLDLPLEKFHPEARKAAEAAQCAAEQGKFWEMRDVLFGQEGKLDVRQYPIFAGMLGLKRPVFDACFKSGKHVPRINRSISSATAIGVDTTPSFVIAKTERGNLVNEGMIVDGIDNYDQFRLLIEQVLAGK